jgi:para-aminobenzoate synthetase component 1
MTPHNTASHDRREFASQGLPLVESLPADLSSIHAFQRLAGLPHVVFLDSAMRDQERGRYSFIAADPFAWIERPADGSKALTDVEQAWQACRCSTVPDLPPFQGGLAGLWGYELARSLENIPTAPIDDLPMPALAIGCYDTVVAFDHLLERAWIVSQGFPESDPQARRQRAAMRIQAFRTLLLNASPNLGPAADASFAGRARLRAKSWNARHHVNMSNIASNLSDRDYRAMMQRAIDYIHAGDLFQVNLSQRLVCRPNTSSLDLYLRLRQRNPAPYAGFLDLGSAQVCSASPECFLTVRNRQVETRPIKGTRGRSASPEADLFTGDDLQQSEKDRAENVMIVDLMRNDLSRVCTPDSVHVAKLCQLETFSYVKHLVSVVRGTLDDNSTPINLLRACFPGGSITGAPKIRAMQVIAELEPTARGAYCGSLGYLGFDGQMDSSILIRTITAAHGWWQFPVGGGIVAQSNPEDEYQETWYKAQGMLEAVRG